MIYISDYTNLSQYIPRIVKKPKDPFDCIDYGPFVGKAINVYTIPGIRFHGILVQNHKRYIVLALKIGNLKNRYTIKVIIKKSKVVAVAYNL